MNLSVSRIGPAALLVGFVLSGCGDLGSSPEVEFDAREPVPSLHFDSDLPSLPRLVDRWTADPSLREVAQGWSESWSEEEPLATRIRHEANRSAAPSLVRAMPGVEVDGLADRIDRAFGAVDDIMDGRIPDGLDGPLADARDARSAARRAEAAGVPEARLAHLLDATDHLRRTTPEALARTLILAVQGELRRSSGVPSYSEERQARIERLLSGAREALASDEPALALRRAWYALGLLDEVGANMDGPPSDGPR